MLCVELAGYFYEGLIVFCVSFECLAVVGMMVEEVCVSVKDW